MDRSLNLWVHPPAGARQLQLRAAGGGLSRLAVAEQLLRPAAPRGAGWIELRALLPEGPAVWRLRLARRRLPDWLTAAPRAAAEGDARATRARTLLKQLPHAPGELQGDVLHRLAGLSAGEQQVSLYRKAMDAHRAAGQLLGEVSSGTALAFCLIQEHRFADARQVLDDVAGRLRLPAAVSMDAKAALAVAYYRGVLARRVGDQRTALRELRGAAETAERLGFRTPWPGSIGQELALTLQDVGRWPEAIAIFQRLSRRPEARSGCDQRGLLLSNYGWSLLTQREALGGGAASSADALPLLLLRQAKEVFDGQGCRDDQRLDVRISLALAAQQSGDAAGARQALADADGVAVAMTRRSALRTPAAASSNHPGPDLAAAAMKPNQLLWRYEIEARLARAQGRPTAALRLYDRLQRLAAGTFSPNGRWLAAYGRARAYHELGDVEKALAAYREAAALIDGQSLDIPIFEGREMFVALREAGTRSFLELLVERGRGDEAFAVARRARSRVLRQLERSVRLAGLTAGERKQWENGLGEYRRRREELDREVSKDWQLAADELAQARAARVRSSLEMQAALDSTFAILGKGGEELAPLRPGELVLAYYELGAGAWVGFAAGVGGAGVRMAPFSLPPGAALPHADELSERLLAPFEEEIRRARRVRVLPFGALKDVDFHALPFDGDILLSGRPVVYGLDVQAPAAAPRQGTGTLRALVLADPRGDLPDARGEARDVGRALSAHGTGWSAEILPGTTDEGALYGRLGGCDLFHYAGHAQSAGAGGWESMLLLAHDTSLTLADLLALPRSPAWVVLSGCDTGRQAGTGAVEVPSLAHAFLLAGARGVIAAVRPVGDRAARDFSAGLYRNWAGEPDLAARLRQTQLALRAANPAAWQSFRLFEP